MHEARGDAAKKGAQKYQGEGMSGAAGMSCLWRHDSVTVGAAGAPSRVAVARLEGFRRVFPFGMYRVALPLPSEHFPRDGLERQESSGGPDTAPPAIARSACLQKLQCSCSAKCAAFGGNEICTAAVITIGTFRPRPCG